MAEVKTIKVYKSSRSNVKFEYGISAASAWIARHVRNRESDELVKDNALCVGGYRRISSLSCRTRHHAMVMGQHARLLFAIDEIDEDV